MNILIVIVIKYKKQIENPYRLTNLRKINLLVMFINCIVHRHVVQRMVIRICIILYV